MDRETRRSRLVGCYVTAPTMFRDDDLELDLPALRRHVRFLVGGGVRVGTGVILAGGAAGDFSTMTFDERVRVAEAVVQEADGKVPVVMGAQTTSTRELVRLAKAAERLGAEYIQVSPPYYFPPTEGDFYEYVVAAAEAADIGIVLYNTYSTSTNIALGMVERLAELPNLVGLKWSVPASPALAFQQVLLRFADSMSVIDNQLTFVTSHMRGARGIELHPTNYWPQWGVGIWRMLEERKYVEVEEEVVRVVLPFYQMWQEMSEYTAGDGYLDKLCMELVGLGSSRCRPPTRDVRGQYKEKVRRMLVQCGVPGVVGA